jgi:hypothetical protein
MIGSSFVRTAVDNDAPEIAAHRSASLTESELYRGHVRNLSTTGVEFSLVAGFGSTVMASLTAHIDSTQAVIQHVFVVSESREVGLGDSLIHGLMTELRSRGVKLVEAQALPGDRGMKNLFERHGLIAQTIIVGKSL